MATMWRGEQLRPGAGLKELGITREMVLSTWFDFDQWVEIRQQEKDLGAVHTQIRQREDAGEAGRGEGGMGRAPQFTLESRARVRFPVMRMTFPFELQMRVGMNSAFEMEHMAALIEGAGQTLRLEAFVENQSLYYAVWSGERPNDTGEPGEAAAAPAPGGVAAFLPQLMEPGKALVGRSPIAAPIVIDDVVLPLLFRAEEVKVGEALNPQVSNPIHGQLEQAMTITVEARETMTVLGREMEVWRLREQLGQWSATSWYDARPAGAGSGVPPVHGPARGAGPGVDSQSFGPGKDRCAAWRPAAVDPETVKWRVE
jgi:hypothetical protein